MSHAHGFPIRFSMPGAPALMRAKAAMAATVATAVILAGCLGERVAGTTSTGNTGKGTISGRVLNAKGEGVANARVRVFSVDHNPGPGGSGPGEVADVALTAADGSFRTDSLADGLYNLLDEKSGELSFRDSVAVDADTAAVAGDDVLRPPGSLSGVVRLQPGDDSRTVFLILPGTTTLALPMDAVGNFRLANLAEGEYRLRILSTLDAYTPLDTVVTIVSGVQGILRDTLRLAYKAAPGAIPVVESLQVAYDSVRIAATLTWRQADPAMAASYRVYRKHRDSAYVMLNQAPLADTAFVDDWISGLRPGNHYEYAVTVVDWRGKEGRKTDGAPINPPGLNYRADVRILESDCLPGICEFDVDAVGSIYVSEMNGAVVRHWPDGTMIKWKDPNTEAFGPRPMAVDAVGGSVYMLYREPLRIGKVDSVGDPLWIKPLPFESDAAFTLHKAGDTLYVWGHEDGVMTYLGLDGEILGQDTLMRFLQRPDMLRHPEYKPGAGFFLKTETGIRLLDRDGRLLADWRLEMRGNLADVERDGEGRWYIGWSTGMVDVYSRDRTFMGSIFTGNEVYYLKFRNGGLFMESSDDYRLIEIVPGF